MMRAIFTSPLELMSHHLTSTLNRAIPLESPDSNTMVGQPALWRKRGFFFLGCIRLLGRTGAEICSFLQQLPNAHLSHSSARSRCAALWSTDGISLIIKWPVSVTNYIWCARVSSSYFSRSFPVAWICRWIDWAFVTLRKTIYCLLVWPTCSSSECDATSFCTCRIPRNVSVGGGSPLVPPAVSPPGGKSQLMYIPKLLNEPEFGQYAKLLDSKHVANEGSRSAKGLLGEGCAMETVGWGVENWIFYKTSGRETPCNVM